MRHRSWLLPGLPALLLCGAANAACPLSSLLASADATVLWNGEMADWIEPERGAVVQFGAGNLSRDAAGLQAKYPRGSYDPAAVRGAGAPLGGAQFRMPFDSMQIAAGGSIGLRYRLRPADNFQFVRGGKLPGLYGGTANTGGHVPNGRDGYSLRFVWQAEGAGALSVYLPTSGKWGSVFGLGAWHFQPGRETDLALVMMLNTPGFADGVLAAWADDSLVAYANDVVFRTTPELGIDGFYFSSFFGGSTPDWATPVDTTIRFGALQVFRVDLKALAACAAPLTGLPARREMR